MFQIVESILSEFRSCFSRQSSYAWFSIVIIGFIVRFDHLGASSFIRWLFLNPQWYDPMLHFFRASSWVLSDLAARWIKVVAAHFPLVKIKDRLLLLGDTIKIGKEAQRMPAVTTLHQESENNNKPEFIRGHHFGFIGVAVGLAAKAFCVPLLAKIIEGIKGIGDANSTESREPATHETLVTLMAQMAIEAAKQMGRLCYVSMDAYFSTGPCFKAFRAAVNEKGEALVHLITRAKDNYVAFFDRGPKPYTEKNKVRLTDVCDFPKLFETAQIKIQGELRTIQYYCEDLLWQPVKGLLRFVWVLDGKDRFILMSSDLELAPLLIIEAYNYRPKIEVMFFALKHLIGGFCYHFWTFSFPELKRGQALDVSKLPETARLKMALAIEAIERFVTLAAITLGILQYVSLSHAREIWESYKGWLRTTSSSHPSELLYAHIFASWAGRLWRNDRRVGTGFIVPTVPRVVGTIKPVPTLQFHASKSAPGLCSGDVCIE